MITIDTGKERFYDVVKRGETTKLAVGSRQIFIGEIHKFLAVFICTNVFTILLVIIMGVSLSVHRTSVHHILGHTARPPGHLCSANGLPGQGHHTAERDVRSLS